MTTRNIAGSHAAASIQRAREHKPDASSDSQKPVFRRTGVEQETSAHRPLGDAAFAAHRTRNYYESDDVPPEGLDIKVGDDEVFYPNNDVGPPRSQGPAAQPPPSSVVSSIASLKRKLT